MGFSKTCAILHLVCLGSSFISCQNLPSLDWQFDPYSTDQWFKQKQDHYDGGNIQYWPQRYVTSYRYYRLGGPIYLYLSGPGPELTIDDIETGSIAAYAEEQGAFVIGLEHRYYGKSRPTSDLSTDNLKYLTVPQAIEDIASFIRSWRSRDEFRNKKWVVFGASYLGSMAAWFAQKHPELIDAFVASSAPLELRYEIPEFLENVGHILNETDPLCYAMVQEGFSCLENVINEQGCEEYTLDDIKSKFEFCADIDGKNPLDVTGIFAELFSTINAVVMYHDPDPKSFPDTNLGRFCKRVSADDGKSPLEKIAERVKEINKHRGLQCAEFRFQTTIDFLREQEWDSSAAKEGYRQLQWQLCNELGWTVASANISQPFGNSLSPFLHSEICKNLFKFTETEMRLKVLQANNDLKGKGLNTKCGIYLHGDHDPWHTFGISSADEAGKCNRAIFIEGGSHGRDVEELSFAESHPPQVKEAQLKVAKYLDSWLKSGKCCEQEAIAESRKVSTYLRSAMAPDSTEFYSPRKDTLRPNVVIRPHAYPVDNGEKLLASPTSIPYQVSTTDVLSVSPRIPVALNQRSLDSDVFRASKNEDFRQYRVVKLLRHHHPTFYPPTKERTMTPSMEQFEADFPEHSIRVIGHVDRVFKNGTKINPQQTSTHDPQTNNANTNQPMGHHDSSTDNTNASTPGQLNQPQNSHRFRYVVKQVFKDVNVEGQTSEGQLNSEEMHGRTIVQQQAKSDRNLNTISSIKTQQSLGNIAVQPNGGKQVGLADISESDEDYSYSSSASTEEVDSAELLEARKPVEIKKRESGEEEPKNLTDETSSSASSETPVPSKATKSKVKDSEEIVVTISSKPKIKETSKEQTKTVETKDGKEDDVRNEDINDKNDDDNDSDKVNDMNSKKENEDESGDEEDEVDEENDEEDNDGEEDMDEDNDNLDEYDEPNYDYEDEGDMEDDDDDDDLLPKPVKIKTSKVRSKHSNKANSSTEYSSGENTKLTKLTEKISKKIMASAESIDENQKQKADSHTTMKETKYVQNRKGASSNKRSKDLESDASTSSEESLSNEDYYNYSLEPSGSNPHKVYRKKLTPITKPVNEEPSTVINVEISGSYPKRRSHHRRSKTTEKPIEELEDEYLEEEITTTKKPRRVHRRRKSSKTRSKATSTTTTMTPITTTEPTSTTFATSTTTDIIDTTSNPDAPTNSYANWNRRRLELANEQPEVKYLQQEIPSIVNLDNEKPETSIPISPPTTAQLPNGDVMYIIIGDVPDNDGGSNMIDDSSTDSLFKFIQKLVNRHSSGMFDQQRLLSAKSIHQPLPPAPTPLPTTTTTTQQPTMPRENPTPSIGGFENSHIGIGKYLLVRPVQVVPLGHERVLHPTDLRNESLINQLTMANPYLYPHKRQNVDAGGYRFKSAFHRDHFEKLLSVDGQVRDSDRNTEQRFYQPQERRRLDQIPDPSWRAIRGISQFGPFGKATSSGSLSLSAADTMWVNEGVPFIPKGNRQHFLRTAHNNGGYAN